MIIRKMKEIVFIVVLVMVALGSIGVSKSIIKEQEKNCRDYYCKEKNFFIEQSKKAYFVEKEYVYKENFKSTMYMELSKNAIINVSVRKEKEKIVNTKKEKKQKVKRNVVSKEEIQLLATLIHAEAGICDEHEKFMVATVTINRVYHKVFPNTLKEVIFQKGQYTSVYSNAWYEEPSKDEKKIAKSVLEGYRECPSDVVFFSGRCDYGEIYCKTNWHEYAELK